MFEKILLISEMIPGFDHVMDRVKELKETGTHSVLLVQCMSPHELNETVSTYITKIYKENLEEQKAVLEQQGFAVKTRQMIGVFRESINQLARDEDCSLMVTGAPERTVLGGLLDSAAAYHMIYDMATPLLLIRIPSEKKSKNSNDAPSKLMEHILFPTDFSENANTAFETVRKLANAGAKKLTLVHVQDQAHLDPYLLSRLEEFNEKDQNRLMELENDLKSAGANNVGRQLVYGSPTAELLRFIQEENISMVVMGSQGRGFIKEITLGNVSNNIARHSPVPVLLIPAVRD